MQMPSTIRRILARNLAVIGMAVALAIPAIAKTPSAAETSADLEFAHRLENVFVRVAEQTSESVVVITTTRANSQSADAGNEESMEQFEGTPFEYFFKKHGMPAPQPHDVDSQGSGIVLRANGFILTNNHVVDKADKIKVRFKDGRELDGTIVGADDRTDVAVVKVNATDLTAARMADSDAVRVGQWAIAIGAPYELDYSFTVGYVSAKGRSAIWSHSGSAYEDYIQTDAAINPGNSGGPLCDIEGRVIGINTLIRGLNRGIGFAIPISMAKEVADQLIDKGRVVRPWIGIQIEALADNKELQETLKGIKDGVVVREIRPGTPAAKSDLKPADIIVAVDGVAVKNPKELQRQILHKQVGAKLALDVIRDGKPAKVSLQTAEMQDEPKLAAQEKPAKQKAETALGLTVQTLNKDLAEKLGLTETQGVVVSEVAEGSLAADKGLQHGDVITEINRKSVRTVEEFKSAMAAANAKQGVLLYYKRNGSSSFAVLKETK